MATLSTNAYANTAAGAGAATVMQGMNTVVHGSDDDGATLTSEQTTGSVLILVVLILGGLGMIVPALCMMCGRE